MYLIYEQHVLGMVPFTLTPPWSILDSSITARTVGVLPLGLASEVATNSGDLRQPVKLLWARMGTSSPVPFVSQMSNGAAIMIWAPGLDHFRRRATTDDYTPVALTHHNQMCGNSESSSKAGMANHIPKHQSHTCFLMPKKKAVLKSAAPKKAEVPSYANIRHCCS